MKLHRRHFMKAIFVGGAIMLAACGNKPTTPVATSVPDVPTAPPVPTATPDPLRAQVESLARIKLPESAHDLHAEFLTDVKRTTVVKFSIPAADLAVTLRQAGYTDSLSEGNATLLPHKNLAWWQPRTAKVIAGNVQGEPGFMRRIGVDKTDPKTYIVYLEHLEL